MPVLFFHRTLLFVFCSVVSAYGQKTIAPAERIAYIKSVPVFVCRASLSDENIKALNKNDAAKARAQLEIINTKIKAEFREAWGLSDSIVFVEKNEFDKARKKLKHCIFVDVTDYCTTIPGADWVTADIVLHPSLPANRNFFRKIDPLFTDTSTVSVITSLRVLAQSASKERVWNDQPVKVHKILINKDDQQVAPYEFPRKEIIKKYPDLIEVVDTPTLLRVIRSRAPGYVYFYQALVVNAEDGMFVKLP